MCGELGGGIVNYRIKSIQGGNYDPVRWQHRCMGRLL